MSQTCIQHPAAAATFRCEGCERTLCQECVQASHALFLCGVCGERAMPLDAQGPRTVMEAKKKAAMSRSYSLREALGYPFRGGGKWMYITTLIASGILWGFRMIGTYNCFSLAIAFLMTMVFLGMIVGLQFKIARTTAGGETEMPDWPDYTDFFTNLGDLVTWFVIHAVIIGAIFWQIGIRISGICSDSLEMGRLEAEPNLGLWIGFAMLLWLGFAFAVMAYGAVGNYRRLKAFEIHNHVQGFISAGADAVNITNMAFGLGAATFLVQQFLQAAIPFVGNALSSMVGIYWAFLVPHLAGLLFRRHPDTMERLYWPSPEY